jgi:hypothetical protein
MAGFIEVNWLSIPYFWIGAIIAVEALAAGLNDEVMIHEAISPPETAARRPRARPGISWMPCRYY